MHIAKTCKATFCHLYNIRRIRKFLTMKSTKVLVQAFIMGCIDYCNSLLYCLPATHINKLQRVQNAAARLICSIPLFSQKMTAAQVVETSVTNNSSFQYCFHPDDHNIRTTDTPGFKLFDTLRFVCTYSCLSRFDHLRFVQ